MQIINKQLRRGALCNFSLHQLDSQGQRADDFTVFLECVSCFWGNEERMIAAGARGAAGDAR